MQKSDFDNSIVNTSKLADLFGVSERQIQRLVKAGVIETCNNGEHPRLFDLTVVVGQYATFLQSGIPLHQWAPKA